MTQIFAIGDIHGQIDMLKHALARIENDAGKGVKVVFLGDYCDRGPDTAAVLDVLVNGQAQGKDWVFLKGNHDRMFEWFLQQPSKPDPYLMADMYWLHPRLGGDTTLQSYGVASTGRRFMDVHADTVAAVPDAHKQFLQSCVLSYETDDLYFCHAGVRPNVPLAQQEEQDLLWIRQEFHAFQGAHPKLIVHGHTPINAPMHYGNRVNLDTGAGQGNALTCAVFESGRVAVLGGDGRMGLEKPTSNQV